MAANPGHVLVVDDTIVNRKMLARAAVAAGCNGLFIEVHPEPAKAKSDAACMLPLERLEPLLDGVLAIRRAVHGN